MGVTRTLFKKPLLIISAILTCFILFTSSSARAQDYATVQTYIHSFNNGVAVATGVFAINKDFNLKTTGYAKYTVDFINSGIGDLVSVSGASSAVSSGDLEDIRNEITAGVTHNLGAGFTVDAYYDLSVESDFVSHTPTISVKKDLFNKNTTLSLGYSRNFDTVEGKFMDSSRTRSTNNFFIGITQVLTPNAIIYAGYSRSESTGQMDEGIRLVALGSQDINDCKEKSTNCAQERLPDSRIRNAYIFAFNYYLPEGLLSTLLDDSAINLKLRLYNDDWDINSYAIEGKYFKHLTKNNLLRLNYRFYNQNSASFYKSNYTGSEKYLSASPQHVDFSTNLFGVKLTHSLRSSPLFSLLQLRSDARIEGKYEFYVESTDVQAHIFMLALRVDF